MNLERYNVVRDDLWSLLGRSRNRSQARLLRRALLQQQQNAPRDDDAGYIEFRRAMAALRSHMSQVRGTRQEHVDIEEHEDEEGDDGDSDGGDEVDAPMAAAAGGPLPGVTRLGTTAGPPPEDAVALRLWNELSEQIRESDRKQANREAVARGRVRNKIYKRDIVGTLEAACSFLTEIHDGLFVGVDDEGLHWLLIDWLEDRRHLEPPVPEWCVKIEVNAKRVKRDGHDYIESAATEEECEERRELKARNWDEFKRVAAKWRSWFQNEQKRKRNTATEEWQNATAVSLMPLLIALYAAAASTAPIRDRIIAWMDEYFQPLAIPEDMRRRK